MSLAYLVAVKILADRYHSGQWSKGYRLGCLAEQYAEEWYGRRLHHMVQLVLIKDEWVSREEVAFWLKRMRNSRHSL